MANKNKDKKTDVIQDAVVEVKKAKPTPTVVQEKFVKVTPKFTGLRFIAGEKYHFTKDKEIEVTQEAKRVLLDAKAIYI